MYPPPITLRNNDDHNYTNLLLFIHFFLGFIKSDAVAPSSKTKGFKVIDKINSTHKADNWEYASFSANTLTGAYSKVPSTGLHSYSNKSAGNMDTKRSSKTDKLDHSISSNTVSNPHLEMKKDRHEQNVRKSSSNMFLVVKRFLFIFNMKEDELRFKELCAFLVDNSEIELRTKVSIEIYFSNLLC